MINMETSHLNSINSIIDSIIDKTMYLLRIYSTFFLAVDFLKMDKMERIIVRISSVVIREEDNTNNNKMEIINNIIDKDLLFGS